MPGTAHHATRIRAPAGTQTNPCTPGDRQTHLRTPAGRASVARALGITALCLAGLAATWVVAALVPVTHARDATALYDFTRLSRPRVDVLANHLLHLLEPGRYTAWALILVGIALVRKRFRLALAIVLVLPLAPLSAEVLKPLLAHPHAYAGLKDINPASWPSGHATAAMTLALCAVLVAPYALQPLVAVLGGAFVVGVGASLLILAWHMPSDVFGGYLLAGLWVSLALTILRATDPRRPPAGARREELRGRGGARPRVGAVRAGLPQ
jgi:membrane-associated phospholipid phosphatase